MKSPILRPAAAADVEHAFLWYETQKVGLGEEFLQEVSATIQAIAESPSLHSVVHRDTRRALLRRFPYSVFYRLVEERVVVVACMHGSREPLRWQTRD